MKDFSKLCTPAKIYFGIAVIATLFDLLNGAALMFAFWKMVFAFVWTFILGGLCDKGYKSISWTLVLLPYILMFLASLNIYHVTDEQRQFMRSIQLQGAYGQEAFTTPSQAALAMGAQQQQAIMAAQQAQAMAAQQAQAMAAQQAQAMAGDQAAYLAAQKAMLEDQAKAADKAELELLRSKLPQAQKDYDNSVGKHPSTRKKLFDTLKEIKDKITKITDKYNGNI